MASRMQYQFDDCSNSKKLVGSTSDIDGDGKESVERARSTMVKSQYQMSPDQCELIQLARDILQEVSSASEICHLEIRTRRYPAFAAKEIVTGNVLGVGSMGIVREIVAFNNQAESTQNNQEQQETPAIDDGSQLTSTIMDSHHHDHDDIKLTMQRRCLRDGEARYAIKTLLVEDCADEKIIRARVDLAIEIKFLSTLNHPNIVRLRGVKKTDDLLNATNFFIMDRLFGTLSDKLDGYFKTQTRRAKRSIFSPNSCKKKRLRDLWVERLVIAYDIHSALQYIHSHKMIHRDLKPANIGFDVRDDVKLFDFGLAKVLSPNISDKHDCGLYNMTGMTGSFPYMAPEVALEKPYNEKCDVFSFGVLLWEILALKSAFVPSEIKSKQQCFQKIVLGGVRPKLPRRWSSLIKGLCKSCWDENLHERPPMEDIGKQIRVELDSVYQNDKSDSKVDATKQSRFSFDVSGRLEDLSLASLQPHKLEWTDTLDMTALSSPDELEMYRQ